MKQNKEKKLKNQRFLESKQKQLQGFFQALQNAQSVQEPLPSESKPWITKQPVEKDSLTELLNKAKKRAKGVPKVVDNLGEQAFLTGVTITDIKKQRQAVEMRDEALDEQVISLLNKKSMSDQLQQLRRQIRQTDASLRSYSKQVQGSKKEINRLADLCGSSLKLLTLKIDDDRYEYELPMSSSVAPLPARKGLRSLRRIN